MEILNLQSIIILFLVGIISGFLNVNAGGGSTLTLPALIFLGLESSVANGTNRIGILVQNISAVYSFKREKYLDLKTSLMLSSYTLPGAIAGSFFAINLNDEIFQKILGVVMIGIILSMIIPQKKNYFNRKYQTIFCNCYFNGWNWILWRIHTSWSWILINGCT